jgi:uncharacterized protein (DUF58 family)
MKNTLSKYLDPVVASKVSSLELIAKLIVEGFITGLHKSPYHGFSVEFAEHKQYNPGDSLKNIDWKVFGKTNKLFTKRYEEETNLKCYVFLDTSDSMRYPVEGISKLEYGIYLTAALQHLMIKQRDAVGLILADESIQTFIPAKAQYSWLLKNFSALEKVLEEKKIFTHQTNSPKVLHEIASRLGRRGLIVMISDLLDNPSKLPDYFHALHHLRHQKHEILIFHLLDQKTEELLDFPNQPIILKDMETGEEIKIQPQYIQKEYQILIQNYKNQFVQQCRESKIDLIPVDIAKPYDKVLLDYLIKRRMLAK